jgi:enamine deaminase RidA (YjgF/YER057c/UK114 family)
VPNPGILASLTTLITGGNSRDIFPGPPLDQKRRGGSTYSDAHHFQATPVTIPRPRDLPHFHEILEPAEESTPVVQAPLHESVRRDLDLVERIIKVTSLVNSTSEYTEHHLVTNGCSDLLLEVFGDAGKHARSAFGVAQLPLGACVEIELIAEIRNFI